MRKLVAIVLLIACFPSIAQYNPYNYTIEKKISGGKAAVVSAHPLASKVGVLIMKKGGNAFDAAIATQLALAVVYPGAGNIGGGGFMVAVTSKGEQLALDYREKAPGAAGRDMYIDKDGNAQTELSQNGHLASGVPGTVAGLFSAHAYAILPFKQLIQPAIDLAEKGFVITESEARSLNNTMGEFVRYSTKSSAFIKYGGWKAGDTLIQKELSNTLKRIRDFGQKGFYEGETARLIVAEMKRGAGFITLADLKNYKTAKRVAMVSKYKDYTIVGMPLVSSGGILIQQMMGMVENRNIGQYGFHSWQAVQLMIEAERRAYADRAEFLGDKDFVKVPVKKLTSASYLQQRMSDFEFGKAGNSKTTGHGNVNPQSEETTHLSVYDAMGNAVSVTTTLNGGYGSRTVVAGAGFILNNEMDDFSIKPGVPNMYGALGTEANAIAPNKRMLSSMTPTIVLKNGKPYLIVGSPGGTTIPTQVYQVLLNILEFNMSLEDAVWKPRFHHQWLPDVVYVEKAFPMELRTKLEEMGYKITERGNIGRFEAIKVINGVVEAVADNRGDDHAEGY
ncbi:gamma-glutamyltransferase [Lacibacter sp. H375]|uniref:gamma-glutamyltransferase n=1 Tax=Lacibacter sp. H375 TaxID=3133424 RepID=UPI0030C0F1D6